MAYFYAPHFDTDGRCSFRIGRKGGGPGEFNEARRLVLAGNHLLVLDPGKGRIERFELSHGTARRLAPLRLDLHSLDLCGTEGDLHVAGVRQGAVVHRLAADGTILRSFGRLYDGADTVRFQIARPGRILCDERRGTITVAGYQVPDVHQYDPDGHLRWRARVPNFVEAELIMDGNRVRGLQPSAAGLAYMAALLELAPGVALVQAGTPTDLGIRKVKTFVLDLESGVLRPTSVPAEWPRVFDIRGDLVLVDAQAWFPQLAIHRR